MKTILIAVALLVPSVSMASIDANVKYGQSGTEVAELQDFLYYKGFLKVNPTGFFGLLTLKATQEYQASENIPNTGYVGVLTRSAINAELVQATGVSIKAEIEEIGSTTPIFTQQAVQQIEQLQQAPMQQVASSSAKLATIAGPRIENNKNSHFRDAMFVDILLNGSKSVLLNIKSDALRDNGKSRVDMDMEFNTSRSTEVATKGADGTWNEPTGRYTYTIKSFANSDMTSLMGSISGEYNIE